ncbi:MAG: DUF4838 domain-containing protein, partial [Planctomycetota bacterium]|nr:DUF4838 domain-containing protein [Planctomycetota bacterium]
MRRSFSLSAIFVVIFLSSGEFAEAQGRVALVRDGQPLCVLVLPEQPDDDEALAARELQVHFEKMSGAKLNIIRGNSPPSDGMIPLKIGQSLWPKAEALIRKQSTDPSAFIISVQPRMIRLAGLSPEGTLFAAYELLEQLGCRWYMPGGLGTVIPHKRTVAIPVGEILQSPSFPSRHLQTVSRKLPWYRHQRLGGPIFPGGHGIRMLPRADFENEPELFSLVDGKRTPRQLCLGNPEVVKRAIAYALDYFEKYPDRSYIGMGPNDGSGFCECEDCRALDSGEWDPYAAEPSVTDRYIWFFNRILKEVHKKHPGKKTAFYAYHSYKLPPRKYKPDSHIVPAFAPITLCRIHGMNNPICPDRSFYKTLMQEWGKLLPEVYERGYYFNLADPCLPFSKVHAIRDETRIAFKAGVKGWRVECMPAWINDTPTLYVAARMMWDVNTDVDELLGEFYRKFFGPAAKPMGEYLEMIDHAFRDTDTHAGGSFCIAKVFTPERMARGRKLLDTATRQAGKDNPFAQRVRLYKLSYERLHAFLRMLETRNRFDFVASKKALDGLSALTDTMLNFRLYPNPPGKTSSVTNRDNEARALWWRSAHTYIKRFWSPCIESGYERLAVRGELVAGCADEWDFLIDTSDIGESAGWFQDGRIGGNWQRIRTKTASWSDQGLHYYKGLAWYRTELEIPAKF